MRASWFLLVLAAGVLPACRVHLVPESQPAAPTRTRTVLRATANEWTTPPTATRRAERAYAPALDAPATRTYARVGTPPVPARGPGTPGRQAFATPLPVYPRTTWRRPSDGWACREAWRTRPLESPAAERQRCICESKARTRSAWLALGGVAVTGIYGLTVWNYGSSTFHTSKEGWFGEDTEYGGADKAGHFISGYFGASIVSALHRSWGLSRREAAWRGALTSMLWMTGIELGDALSEDFGFSFEDLAADALGCLAAWLHDSSPWVHRTLDFRWEYWPSERGLAGEDTPTDDYEGSAYLVALNVGALVSRSPTTWDLLDLQVGYKARGYVAEDGDPERWVFVGVGLNLANLLRRVGFRYAAFFDYYQAPFISLRLGFELNDGETEFLYAP